MTHTCGLVCLSAALLCGCTSLTVKPVLESQSGSASVNAPSEDAYDEIVIETQIPSPCTIGLENLWIRKNMNGTLFAQIHFDGATPPTAVPFYSAIAEACKANDVKVVQLFPYGQHVTGISLRALSGSTTELTEFSQSSFDLLSSLAVGGLSRTLSTMKEIYETPQMKRFLAEYKAIESKKIYSSGTEIPNQYGTYKTTFYQIEYDQTSSQAKAVDQYRVPNIEDQFLVVKVTKDAIASQLLDGRDDALINKARTDSTMVPSRHLVGRTETISSEYSRMTGHQYNNCSAIDTMVQQEMQLNRFDRVVVTRALAASKGLLGRLDDYCEIPPDIRLLWKYIYPGDFVPMPELPKTSMHKETWSKKVGILLKDIVNNFARPTAAERQVAWRKFPSTRTGNDQRAHFNVSEIGAFDTSGSITNPADTSGSITNSIVSLSELHVDPTLVGCFTAPDGDDSHGQLVFAEGTSGDFKFWKVAITVEGIGNTISVDFSRLTSIEQQELRDYGTPSSEYSGNAHCPKIRGFL